MKRTRPLAFTVCVSLLFNASGMAMSVMHPESAATATGGHCAQADTDAHADLDADGSSAIEQADAAADGDHCCAQGRCACMMAASLPAATRLVSSAAARMVPPESTITPHRPVPRDDSLRPPIS